MDEDGKPKFSIDEVGLYKLNPVACKRLAKGLTRNRTEKNERRRVEEGDMKSIS